MNAMSDDMNVSRALSEIEDMISNGNDKLDNKKGNKKEIYGNIKLIERVLGIGNKNPYEYFQIGITKEEKEYIEKKKKNEQKQKKKKIIIYQTK